MCKVKESTLDPDGIPQLVEDTYNDLKYKQLFERVMLSLLANPAFITEETPTAVEYITSAKDLTKAILAHLNTK